MKRIIAILLFLFALSFKVSAQTETAEKESTVKVKVFPNPATNVINILGLQNSSRAEILVTDTYGNVVLEHRWAIKNKALNIPISTLSSGIYSITIRSLEQRVQTKFYKQ